jgi:hypothetical protein
VQAGEVRQDRDEGGESDASTIEVLRLIAAPLPVRERHRGDDVEQVLVQGRPDQSVALLCASQPAARSEEARPGVERRPDVVVPLAATERVAVRQPGQERPERRRHVGIDAVAGERFRGDPEHAERVEVAGPAEVPGSRRQQIGRCSDHATLDRRSVPVHRFARLLGSIAIDGLFPPSRSLGHRAPHLYRRFVRSLRLDGDVAECGVYTGTTSKQFVRHLLDTFEGFPDVLTEPDRAGTATSWLLGPGKLACPVAEVVRRMDGMTGFRIHRGCFSETFREFSAPLCFIHSDADLYRSTAEVIELADRCLVPGGTIVFDDYGSELFPGVGLAIRQHLDLRTYEAIPSRRTLQFVAVKRTTAPAP